MTATVRPFCDGNPASEAAFDRWRGRFEAAGVDLPDEGADAYVLGLLASREAALERLRADVDAETDMELRLKIVQAERRAAADFRAGLELAERVFGARAGEISVPVPIAVGGGGGGGRVVQMPRRVPDTIAGRGKGPDAVHARILGVLADASQALTKDELQKRTPGDPSTFLRELKTLIASGAVKRSGAGRRGDPYRYFR